MRKILCLICAIIFVLTLVTGCNEGNDSVHSLKMITFVHDDAAQAWVWMQKKVTERSDVDLILNEINSMDLTKVLEDQSLRMGAGITDNFNDSKGNEYNFWIAGSLVKIDEIYYDIEYEHYENLDKLYKTLNYEQTHLKF